MGRNSAFSCTFVSLRSSHQHRCAEIRNRLIILILTGKFALYFRRHFCDKRRGRSHLISTLPHNPVFPR
ncbi:hypothetical protein DP897_05785 [Escherichia coli]|nr:hypothetical protein [Escherichia coli]HAH3288718.1 hypothetical protein [Escherichia coli]